MLHYGFVLVFLVGCAAGTDHPRPGRPFRALPESPEPPAPVGASPTPEQLHQATVPGSYDKHITRSALDSATGETWTLVAWGGAQLEHDSRAPTLSFANGRASGFAGCNRFVSTVNEPVPGTLHFAALSSTRMACGDQAMEAERRYLETLASVNRYVLEAGKLHLFREGDESSRLTYRRPTRAGK
jgi:heat shock protein HslJ